MEWWVPVSWLDLAPGHSAFDYQLVSFDTYGTPGVNPRGSFDPLKLPLMFAIFQDPGPGVEGEVLAAVDSLSGYRLAEPLGLMLVDYTGDPTNQDGPAYLVPLDVLLQAPDVPAADPGQLDGRGPSLGDWRVALPAAAVARVATCRTRGLLRPAPLWAVSQVGLRWHWRRMRGLPVSVRRSRASRTASSRSARSNGLLNSSSRRMAMLGSVGGVPVSQR